MPQLKTIEMWLGEGKEILPSTPALISPSLSLGYGCNIEINFFRLWKFQSCDKTQYLTDIDKSLTYPSKFSWSQDFTSVIVDVETTGASDRERATWMREQADCSI